MRQEKIAKIQSQITSIEELPTLTDLKSLIRLASQSETNYWRRFCWDNDIHDAYSIGFMRQLAQKIKKLDKKPIIEICAGSGKLSYHLNKRSIPITATDDYSWKIPNNKVELLSHKEALQTYKPKIVVAAWIPHKSQIGFDVLNTPSVEYFIDMGEGLGHSTWMTNEIFTRTDWTYTNLEIEENLFCRTDFEYSQFKNQKREFCQHSEVRLFTRK